MTRAFALWLWAVAPAVAQAPPTPPAAPSPPQRAFEALPEADRKAAQDGLGWLGFYNGVDNGAFGKRTADALKAYQKSLGAAEDGVLTAKLVAALKEAEAKAKAGVGFKMLDDAATGVRIGAPLKALEKRESAPGGSSFVAKDGSVALYVKETKGDLAALFKTMTTESAVRKVTYKVLKAGDFFVVASEEGDNKVYRRYAAQGDKLRGFAFSYPKARAKALDPVALAVANSFEPFPSAPLPPTAPTPSPTPTPEPPKLAATALILGPGVAVAALDAGACKAPTVAGKPAQILDAKGPLIRIGGDFGAGASPPPLGPGGAEMVALSLAADGGRTSLVASPAQPIAGGQILAALGSGGAPLFDRQGRFVAFAGASGRPARRGGVPLAAPRAAISLSALGLASGEGAAKDLTAAEIAKLRHAAVIGVFCAS